jgi:hypothetical protein
MSKIQKKYDALLKVFNKCRAKTDIKPPLAGVYANKEQGVLVATDSFVLASIEPLTNNMLKTGVYNPERFETIGEEYPDYTRIIPDASASIIKETLTVADLIIQLQEAPREIINVNAKKPEFKIKYKNNYFAYNYIALLVDFIVQASALYGENNIQIIATPRIFMFKLTEKTFILLAPYGINK